MLVLMIRTIILYATVIISLRIMGKRQLGELQPSELVVAIMISDLAAVPMQAIDIPILSGIIPVLTLVVAEVFISYMGLKSKRVRRIITGEPSIVIYNGHINENELRKLRFNINDLLEELRINSCHDISDVAVAIVETSGKLTVISKDKARSVTVEDMKISNPRHDGLPFTLISDGKLNENELTRSGKDMKWLTEQLKQHGMSEIKQVFIASLDAEGEIYLQKKGEKDKD